MAVRLEYPDVDTMVKQKLPDLWATCNEKPDKWTSNSFHWKMLQFVAGDLRLVNEFVFDLLVQTIASTTCPEIKLKSFNLLTASMERVECDPAQFQCILLANIKWKPGRSASVLRSCVALCAFTAILHNKIEITPSNVDVYADAFLHLVEDEIVNSRLTAIRVLKRCLLVGKPANLDTILTSKLQFKVHFVSVTITLFAALMGRLNDVSKGVMAGLRDAFLNWRKEGSPHQVMEKRFIELTRILSRDDDLPSKTYAEGKLRLTHEFICILKREFRLKRRFAIDAGRMHVGSG